MSEPFRDSYFNAIQMLSDELEDLRRERRVLVTRLMGKCFEAPIAQGLVAALCFRDGGVLGVVAGIAWSAAVLTNLHQGLKLWRNR